VPELTDAQIAARVDGMGSTDIVEVCGLAPWEGAGPWRVYNLKTGVTKPEPPTEEQAWGHIQERVIATWYVDHVGPFEVPPGPHYIEPARVLWASLDGITPDRCVEIKNVGGFMCKHWDVTDPDGIPHYVRAQVTFGMLAADRQECHVVASLAGRPPEMWTVRYDPELAAMLYDRGLTFWRSVVERTPPPLDASDECREYLRHKYPKDERRMLVPDLETAMRLDRIGRSRCAYSERLKETQEAIKEADTSLLAAIGDHAGYEGDGFKMTWKADKNGKRRSRFTVKGDSDE
jgi:putative phage-type endonuclease